jgi:hypothetical protein
MLGCEQRPHEAALRVGEQRDAFAAGSVEHCERIASLLLDGVGLDDPLGQTGAAAVVEDQAAECRESFEEAAVRGCLPQLLELREPTGQEEQIERPVADDLVGDARVVAARVAGDRHHQGSSIRARNGAEGSTLAPAA